MNFNMKEESKFRLMVQSDLIWKTKMFMVNNLGKVLAKTIFACLDWTGHHQLVTLIAVVCEFYWQTNTFTTLITKCDLCLGTNATFLVTFDMQDKYPIHDFVYKKVKRDSGHNWNIGQLRHKPAITNCLLQANKKLVCF